MNQIKQKLAALDPKTRRAFWLAVILTAALLGYGVYAIPKLFGSVWIIHTISNSMPALMGTFSLTGALLLLNGRKTQGGILLITSISAGLLIITGLISDIGLLLAALAFVISAYLANLIFSDKALNWYPIISLVIGALILLLDAFCPWPRDWVSTQDAQVAGFLGVGLLLLYSIFVVRQFGDFSLRTKLIISFLLITIVPIAVVSITTNYLTQQALLKAANNDLQTTASQIAANLDAFVHYNLDTMQGDARIADFVDFLEMPAAEREQSGTARRVQSILESFRQRNPTYISSFGIIDAKGISVADTNADDIGKDKSTHDYFIESLRTGLPYVSNHFISNITGKPSIYFSVPIRNHMGKIIGVLRARYNADILQQQIVQTDLGYGEVEVLVVDDHNILLADNLAPARMYKVITPLSSERLAEYKNLLLLPSNVPDNQLVSAIPDLASGLAKADQFPTFEGEIDLVPEENHPVIPTEDVEQAAAVKMATRPWYVVVSEPQPDLFIPVKQQTRSAVVLGVSVSLLSVLLAVVVAQYIADPIVSLTGMATRIAGGDLLARAHVNRADETGLLARTFNQMTAELNSMIGTLELRVADRTRALSTSAEVSRQLSTILDTNQLLREVVTKLKEAFNFYHVHIYMFDEAREHLVLMSGSGEAGQVMLSGGHKLPKGRGLVGKAADTGVLVLARDVSQAPAWLPNPLLPETKSELAVPIAIGDHVLGVIDVQENVVNGLNHEDANLLQSIADQVAVGLQNARQYTQTKESERLIRTVIDSTPDWIFIKDQQHRYRLVNKGYANALHLEPRDFIGKNDLDLGFPEELVKGSREKGITGFWTDDRIVMDGGEARVFPNDVAAIDGVLHHFNTIKTPLVDANGSIWGVLAFCRDETEREMILKETEALYQATSQLAGSHTYDEILQAVIENSSLKQFDSAALYFFNRSWRSQTPPDTIQMISVWERAAGSSNFKAGQTIPTAAIPVIDQMVSIPYLVIGDATTDPLLPDVVRMALIQNGILSTANFRLMIGDEWIGNLSAYSAQPRQVSESDVRQMNILVEQAGTVIQSLRLLEQVQNALQQTATLYTASRRLNESGTMQEMLAAVLEGMHGRSISQAVLIRYQWNEQNEIEAGKVVANWHRGEGPAAAMPVGAALTAGLLQALSGRQANEPAYLADIENDLRLDPASVQLLKEMKAVSSAVLPLWVGGRQIGLLGLQPEQTQRFTDQEMRSLQALTSQLAVAVESRRLFEETAQSERRFRYISEQLSQALDVAKMAYWEFDLAKGMFIFNDTFYKSLGTTAEAEGGYEMNPAVFAQKYVHPDDGALVGAATQRALESTDPNFRIETTARQIRADGTEMDVLIRFQTQRDEQGYIIRLLGANQDVSEQRRVAEQIENQRRTLQAVLDYMPAGVFMVEAPSGKPILSNKQAEAFLGCGISPNASGDDLNQVYPLYRFGTNEPYPVLEMPVAAGVFGCSLSINDMEVRRPDGTRLLLEVNGTPIYNAAGEVIASLAMFQDITDRYKAQETIAKRAVELATVAEVSTRVATIQSPDEMLQTVVDLTRQAFALYHAHIYQYDDNSNLLFLSNGAGEIGRRMVAEGRQIHLTADQSLVARAARLRQGVIVNDIRLEPEFLPHPLLPDTRSEMAVPMIVGDNLLGVIDIQSKEPGRFSPEDVNIMTTLAAQVAISLQNARSFARAQRQAEREALINAISERIQSTNSIEGALQVAVREIGRALGAQHTAIRLGLERKAKEDENNSVGSVAGELRSNG